MTIKEQIYNMEWKYLFPMIGRAKRKLRENGYNVFFFDQPNMSTHEMAYLYVRKAMRAICGVSVGDP